MEATTITRRPQLNSFALYLMSLAAMIGLYSVYARFLVPILEGPPNIVRARPAAPNVELSVAQFDQAQLDAVLPDHAWETGERKTLVTSQGTILFQKFERVEGGYLEVIPFTLLSNSSDAKNSLTKASSSSDATPPTVLRCATGAKLKFDDPFADPLAGKSKLESAMLVGAVEITRAVTRPDADDAIAISTSNVQINREKIFTIDPVTFSVGSNHGSGKNLSIEFAHEDQRAGLKNSFETINGFQRIELAFLNQLRLEPKQQNQSATTGDSNEPVNITCTGPFVFDFNQRTATFLDRVKVEMENPFRDNVLCDRLTVHFDDAGALRAKSSNKKTANEDNALAPELSNWDLKQLVAEGQPAVIFSPGRAAKVTGDVLSYNVLNGEVLAERTSAATAPVAILSPEFKVSANRIEYQMQSDGGLGKIAAIGPGSLLRMATETAKEFFVEWNKQLNVQPDGTQHRISLDGGCLIRLDNATQIKADQLQIWLNEIPIEKTEPDGSVKATSEYQPDRMQAIHNVEILSNRLNGTTEKLIAVWHRSEQPLQTQFQIPLRDVQRLARTVFETELIHVLRPVYQTGNGNPTTVQPTPVIKNLPVKNQFFSQPREQIAGALQTDLATEASNVNRDDPGWLADPANDSIKVARAGFQQELAGAQKKFAFRGDEVNVKLLFDQQNTAIEDLTATGNVLIAEIASAFAETDTPPLTVTGQFLRCVPQSQQQVRILVSGTEQQPAAVAAERLKLTGQQVHLDQAANKLWVEGAGEVQLENKPTDAETSSNIIAGSTEQRSEQRTATSSPANANYKTVSVIWTGGMVFDGRKVYFEDGVQMVAAGINSTGNPVVTRAVGEGLSLQLNQAINFRDLETDANKNKIEVQEMVIVDTVLPTQRIFKSGPPKATNSLARNSRLPAVISNQTLDDDRNPTEQYKFVASQATLNAVTGVVHSKGPGVLLLHRRGAVPMLPTNKANAQAPPKNNAISLVRINFDGAADANLNRKELLITGNVRTMYSPIGSFDEVLDPDSLPNMPPDAVKVTCDNLKLVQWTPRNAATPSNELIASGNARIVSSQVEAIADRVSFNQATSMLVVEGTPRSNANLWFRDVPHAQRRQELVAGKIMFNTADQSYSTQDVEVLNLNQK